MSDPPELAGDTAAYEADTLLYFVIHNPTPARLMKRSTRVSVPSQGTDPSHLLR